MAQETASSSRSVARKVKLRTSLHKLNFGISRFLSLLQIEGGGCGVAVVLIRGRCGLTVDDGGRGRLTDRGHGGLARHCEQRVVGLGGGSEEEKAGVLR